MADTRWRKFNNNATARLATDLTDVTTVIALESGAGARFPTLDVNEIFKLVVRDIKTGVWEIMACTSRADDALTVERAQEGTAAAAFNKDDTVVFHQITADDLEYLQDLLS